MATATATRRSPAKTLVGTARVREWGEANGWTVSGRGRLHSGLIKDFNDNNTDNEYYTPDVRSTATNRVQPDAEAPTKPAPVVQQVSPDVIPAEIVQMLQAASKGRGGQKVLIAAYTLADLDTQE